MGCTFNPQFLVEKLVKLDSSQQRLRPSHWCIFHINKNSRRKGSKFVGKFWKVLPGALCDVIDKGDEFGRNTALRLVSIWEERYGFRLSRADSQGISCGKVQLQCSWSILLGSKDPPCKESADHNRLTCPSFQFQDSIKMARSFLDGLKLKANRL